MRVLGFPGQGAQARGMGGELFREFPDLVAAADEVLGYSIARLCLDDPDGELRLTRFAQPALYVVSALAFLRHRRDGALPPDALAGHSVGEFAALFAAGVFDFGTGLRLVRRRGELMSRGTPGGMAAVLGLELADVTGLLREADLPELDIALHNAPGQVAVAGPDAAIDRLVTVAAERELRCVPLKVSGPFHSRYLAGAARDFTEYLGDFRFAATKTPVLANATAALHTPETTAELLARQITSPVLWQETMCALLAEGGGDFDFVELGPGSTLTGMLKRIRTHYRARSAGQGETT